MQLSKSKDSSIRPLPADSTPGSGRSQWPLMHCGDTNQPFRRLRAGDVLGARFIFLSLPHWLPASTQLVIILALTTHGLLHSYSLDRLDCWRLELKHRASQLRGLNASDWLGSKGLGDCAARARRRSSVWGRHKRTHSDSGVAISQSCGW